MRDHWLNEAHAANPAMTSLLLAGHQWRWVADAQRSAASHATHSHDTNFYSSRRRVSGRNSPRTDISQLPLDAKVRQPNSLPLAGPPIVQRMVSIPAGVVTLGLARSPERFGWDHEYAAHTVDVPAFEIDRHKVTNRQYLEFMAAGGYETHALWEEDDWNWKTAHGIFHPLFWKREGNR